MSRISGTLSILILLCVIVTCVQASPRVEDPKYTLEVFANDLDGPFGLAFDKNGSLYVANEGASEHGGGTTISRITRDGQVSTYATGFTGPAGLAFDEKGNLWVSDDRRPISIWKIGTDGSIAAGSYFEFGNPNAIEFDKDWNLFVAAANSGYIYKVSPEGAVAIFAGPFACPQALAFDKTGNLYTSDFSGTIYRIDPLGSVSVFSTGVLRSTEGGLAFDDAGNLYASEAGAEGLLNVYVFAPSGEGNVFVSGFEPADFNFPRGLIFDERGRLYVTEYSAGIVWRIRSGPFAKFEFSSERPAANEQITFNASASGGDITKYEWDFGDGNRMAVSEPLINHTYGREGRCNVTLNVTDTNGLWNATTETVTITFWTDLDKNGQVSIVDITIVATSYGTKSGDLKWNPIADLDKNGRIDILDIAAIARDYGKTI